MKNTFIILQARMNSNRLPGKVMMPIEGIPMIGILIQRLKKSNLPIILATTDNNSDDELVEYASSLDVKIFRGSELNVLERYYQASKEAGAKTIIRVTGDSPLMDGEFVRENVEEYLKINDERAYLTSALSQSFPLGMSAEVFSSYLLEEAYKNAHHPGEYEHVTPYMHQNIPGNVRIISLKRPESKYNYRLTVDTPEDFILIKKLIEDFGCEKLSMEQIITIIDNNPSLISVNQGIHQKRWDE